MQVIKMPEDGTKFVDYTEEGNMIIFGDDELMVNAKKKERDYDVTIDICRDWMGGLVAAAHDSAIAYIAQILIPARQYEYVESEEKDEKGDVVTKQVAVPFSMDNVALKLWKEEE